GMVPDRGEGQRRAEDSGGNARDQQKSRRLVPAHGRPNHSDATPAGRPPRRWPQRRGSGVHSGPSLSENGAMAGARRYRFVGAWALAQIVAGSLFVFMAALTAFAVLSPWPVDVVSRVPPELRSRLAPAAIAAVVLAVMLGGSLVLSGQLLLMLRDVHRHVARLGPRQAPRRRGSSRPSDRRGATPPLLPPPHVPPGRRAPAATPHLP